MSIGENQPAVERSRSLLAAAAGLEPKIRGRPLERIAKPDFFIGDKSRQMHLMGRAFDPAWRIIVFACFIHEICLFAFADNRIW